MKSCDNCIHKEKDCYLRFLWDGEKVCSNYERKGKFVVVTMSEERIEFDIKEEAIKCATSDPDNVKGVYKLIEIDWHENICD